MSCDVGVHVSSTSSRGPLPPRHTPSLEHVPAHAPHDAPHTGSGPHARAAHWGTQVASMHCPASHVSAHAVTLCHQVWVVMTQIDTGDGAHGAIAGDSAREPMRGNAHAHTALHNRQQAFALQFK